MAALDFLRRRSWVGIIAFSAALLFLPELGLNLYWQRQAIQIVIYFLLASSVTLVLGLAGEFALSQVAVMAAGAYASAIMFNHGHHEIIWSILVAIAGGVVLSLLTGIPSIRLSSWTLGLVSFFLVLLLPGVVKIFQKHTGGLEGIGGLIRPTFFGVEINSNQRLYTVAVILALLWLYALRNLIHSRFGAALQNMRESPTLSTSLGSSTLRLRLTAYVISSIPAAIAGVIYSFFAGFVSPEGFALDNVVAVVAAAVVGGLGSVFGAVIGAVLLVVGVLRASSFKEYSLIIYGGFLLGVAVLFPTGVAGALRQLELRFRRRKAASAAGVAAAAAAASVETEAERPQITIPGETLEVTGVTKSFGGVRALNEVSFRAEPGKVTGLLGPNGAGKTTLLNTISGFIPVDAGKITIGTTTTSGLKAEKVARVGVGRTFQTPMIPRSMSVIEIVESGRLPHGRMKMLGAVLRLPTFLSQRKADRKAAMDALRFAGLGHLANDEALALPLGTRRLLEVVRAVVVEPHVVLLDEPAAGLDDDGLNDLAALIRLMRDAGATIVLVEHNVPFVMSVSDSIFVLDFGVTIASGTPDEVRTNEKVIASYLGGPRKSAKTADAVADAAMTAGTEE